MGPSAIAQDPAQSYFRYRMASSRLSQNLIQIDLETPLLPNKMKTSSLAIYLAFLATAVAQDMTLPETDRSLRGKKDDDTFDQDVVEHVGDLYDIANEELEDEESDELDLAWNEIDDDQTDEEFLEELAEMEAELEALERAEEDLDDLDGDGSSRRLGVDIKKCSSNARDAIRMAYQWMVDHTEELRDDFNPSKRRLQRRRIRRRFKRKLNKLKVSCAERVLCRDGQDKRVGFHGSGILGNKIRLCYNRMIDLSFHFCDLVETMVHEFGHVLGIPKARFGSHYRNQDDRVYRFGWHGGDLCRQEFSGATDYPLAE